MTGPTPAPELVSEPEQFAPALVDLAARAIAETRTDCDLLHPCEACRASVRAVLSALAAAGRLRDGDTETEWAVRFSDGSVSTGLWTTEKSARLRAAEYGYPDAEPVRRWVGPWLPIPTEETPTYDCCGSLPPVHADNCQTGPTTEGDHR